MNKLQQWKKIFTPSKKFIKTVKRINTIFSLHCLKKSNKKSESVLQWRWKSSSTSSSRSWVKVASCTTFCLFYIISLKAKAVLIRTLHKISTHQADLYHSLAMSIYVVKRHKSLVLQTQYLTCSAVKYSIPTC
jgi:hypothetical protein